MERISDLLPKVFPTSHPPRHKTTWRDKVPSNKQRAVLVDNGYRVPPTRGEAAELIATFLEAS